MVTFQQSILFTYIYQYLSVNDLINIYNIEKKNKAKTPVLGKQKIAILDYLRKDNGSYCRTVIGLYDMFWQISGYSNVLAEVISMLKVSVSYIMKLIKGCYKLKYNKIKNPLLKHLMP